jgi:hypothetical protein
VCVRISTWESMARVCKSFVMCDSWILVSNRYPKSLGSNQSQRATKIDERSFWDIGVALAAVLSLQRRCCRLKYTSIYEHIHTIAS